MQIDFGDKAMTPKPKDKPTGKVKLKCAVAVPLWKPTGRGMVKFMSYRMCGKTSGIGLVALANNNLLRVPVCKGHRD
jgi:hypothetical protein